LIKKECAPADVTFDNSAGLGVEVASIEVMRYRVFLLPATLPSDDAIEPAPAPATASPFQINLTLR
jgi:hypothetical protein